MNSSHRGIRTAECESIPMTICNSKETDKNDSDDQPGNGKARELLIAGIIDFTRFWKSRIRPCSAVSQAAKDYGRHIAKRYGHPYL